MRNKLTWKEYRDFLLVAYFIAACVSVSLAFQFGVPAAFLVWIPSGLVFGTLFFLLSLVRYVIRIRSFALNVLAQSALMAATVVVGSTLLAWFVMAAFNHRSPFDPIILHLLRTVINPLVIVGETAIGLGIASIVNAMFEIDRKMGHGIIWNWITGKYYNPTEEERIFMFLDMKDSTLLAEQLGNLKFSALVRDFFQDMTFPLTSTKGEVSHYIGDEAVLTWKPAVGLQDAHCIVMFLLMQEAIEARRPHYLAQYGLVPEFKAGAHIGKVVATEVGEVKSEIVFHGDVLNTAARIQGLCNEEGHGLLISSELAERLPPSDRFSLIALGSRSLKGKAGETEIFAVK